MTKLQKAVYFAENQVDNRDPYIWSGQGEKLKSLSVLEAALMETSLETFLEFCKYVYTHVKDFNSNTKVYDCSGFITCMLIYAGILKKNTDYTANDLFNKFPEVPVSDRRCGDLVYKSGSTGRKSHVGFVLNPNYVIEAKGRKYGVVRSAFDSSWTNCNRPEY